MFSHSSRNPTNAGWLGPAVLAATLLACTFSAGAGGTGGIPTGSTEVPGASAPQPGPSGETFELTDPEGDCFSGLNKTPSDCRGLDMTGLFVGLPADLPSFNEDPLMAGRLDFVLTFDEELAGIEAFGLCLWMDLDQDPATGKDLSGGWGGIPGIDRGVCVEVPTGTTYFYYYHPSWDIGVDREQPLYDDSQAAALIEGNRVAIGIAPALLAPASNTAAHGFYIFLETARSIDPLDNFNDQGTLWQAQPITIPDEVVTQVQP